MPLSRRVPMMEFHGPCPGAAGQRFGIRWHRTTAFSERRCRTMHCSRWHPQCFMSGQEGSGTVVWGLACHVLGRANDGLALPFQNRRSRQRSRSGLCHATGGLPGIPSAGRAVGIWKLHRQLVAPKSGGRGILGRCHGQHRDRRVVIEKKFPDLVRRIGVPVVAPCQARPGAEPFPPRQFDGLTPE